MDIIIEPQPDFSRLYSFIPLFLPLIFIKINITLYPILQIVGLFLFYKLRDKEYEVEYSEWKNGKIQGYVTLIQHIKGLSAKNIKIPTGDGLKIEGAEYGDEKLIFICTKGTRNAGRIVIDYDPKNIKIEHDLPCPVRFEDGTLYIACNDDVTITKTLGLVDETPVFDEKTFEELKTEASVGIFIENTITDNKLRILPPGAVTLILPGPKLTPKNYFDIFREKFGLDVPFGTGTYRVTINNKTYTIRIIYEDEKCDNDEGNSNK